MHPLRQYLMSVEEPITDFAARVGASRQTLHRIISRAQAPKPALARMIVEATGGAVSWEALYQDARYSPPAPEERAQGPAGLEQMRLKTAIAAIYNHFAAKGADPAPDALIGAGVKASIEIYEALSCFAGRPDTERLAQTLRPVLECILSEGGTRLSPALVERAVKLGADLYRNAP